MSSPGYEIGPAPQSPPKKSNTALIVLAVIGVAGMCLCLPILAAILFPVFAQAREAAKLTVCKSNLQAVGEAVVAYSEKNDGYLPKAETWAKDSEPFARKQEIPLCCPVLEGGKSFGAGYGINPRLAGRKIADLGSEGSEPLLVEVDASGPAVLHEGSGPPRRHMRGRKYNAFEMGRGTVTRRVDSGGRKAD